MNIFQHKLFISLTIFLFIFNFLFIYSLQKSWLNSVSNFLPILQHTQNIKYQLASGHLWLEEHLTQSEDIDIKKEILRRQESVLLSSQTIKDLLVKSSFSDLLLNDFTKIEEEILTSIKLAKARIDTNIEGKYNKELNIYFNTHYNELQELLLDFRDDLSLILEKKRESRNSLFLIGMLSFLFFNASMLFLFYKIRKNSLKHYAELLEQKKAFEGLYKDSKDGILLLKNEHIYDCNISVLKMFGVKSKKEILNLHPSDLSPAFQADNNDSYVKTKKMISLAMKNGSHTFEWLHKRVDGKNFMSEVSLTFLRLNDEDIIHASMRDITARIELEKEYDENQKILFQELKMAQMGSMLSSIAHQWKQPLSKINSKLLKLSSSLTLTKENQNILDEHIEDIETITSYMGNTIENFRTYFEPSQEKGLFNLSEVIDKAHFLSSLSDMSSSIEFISECRETIEYYGYKDELLQVIIILLNNAKEAHEQNHTSNPFIKVKVVDYAINLEILIIDNAGGISKTIQDKIFNPYFTTKDTKENSGIGLSTAKMIIENSMCGLLSYKNIDNNSYFTMMIKGYK